MPITHQWNGTILTITSDSGTSSAELKGEKGDDGVRGAQGIPGGTLYSISQAANNLLDNSYFLNPINQRGQTEYTGICYTLDRWRTWGENAKITLTNAGIKSDGADTSVLSQGIEAHKIKLGRTYTVGIGFSDGTIVSETGIAAVNATVGVWNDDLQACLVYDSSPFFRLWSKDKIIQWVALYEGEYTDDTLPAYQYKGYAAELAECQRYYIKITTQPVNGWCYNWGRVSIFIPTATQMRTTNPTITTTNSNFYIGSASYAATLSGGTATNNGISIYFSHTAATNGQCIIPEFAAEISADL